MTDNNLIELKSETDSDINISFYEEEKWNKEVKCEDLTPQK